MSLKILIIPFLLVMSLILAVGYVKEDFVLLLGRIDELSAHKAERDEVDKIQNLILSASKELALESEKLSFLDTFIPDFSDHERAIDAANYLATKTGILLTSVDVSSESPAVVTEAEPQVARDALGLPVALSTSMTAEQPRKFEPGRYTMTVGAVGTYRSIRDYLVQMSRSSRFVGIQGFELHKLSGVGDGEKRLGGTTDAIEARIVGEFSYLPRVSIDNAMTYRNIFDPARGFSRNLSLVANVMDTVTADIPTLVTPTDGGRENPFLN